MQILIPSFSPLARTAAILLLSLLAFPALGQLRPSLGQAPLRSPNTNAAWWSGFRAIDDDSTARDSVRQHAFDYGVSFGPKGFLAVSSIYSETLEDKNFDHTHFYPNDSLYQSFTFNSGKDFSYGFGLFADIKLNKTLSLLAEATYSRIGAKYESDYQQKAPKGTASQVRMRSDISIRMNRIETPLMLKVTFPGALRFHLLAGAALNLNMGGALRYNELRTSYSYVGGIRKDTTYSSPNDSSALDGYTGVTFSGIAGIGISVPVAGNPLHISLRYSIPVGYTQLYTTENTFEFATRNTFGYIFSQPGKEKAESAGQYQLNDFRLGYIGLHLNYGIFQ